MVPTPTVVHLIPSKPSGHQRARRVAGLSTLQYSWQQQGHVSCTHAADLFTSATLLCGGAHAALISLWPECLTIWTVARQFQVGMCVLQAGPAAALIAQWRSLQTSAFKLAATAGTSDLATEYEHATGLEK